MQQARTFVIRALIALAIAHGAAAQAPTVVISPVPMIQFFDNNGKPLAGGCVATYQAGTTTPLQTFKDSTGMIANQNPVMLDASGRAPIWINVNAIKYVVKAKSSSCSLSAGTVLYTTDGVQDQGLRLRSDLSGVNGAGNIGFQQPGGIPITVGAVLSMCPDASHYANFAAAIANVPAGGCLNCSSGLTGPVTITRAVSIHGHPGCSVQKTSNTPAITVSGASNVTFDGVGSVDGRYSQNAYKGPTVSVGGSNYVKFDGWSVNNSGSYGIIFDGSTTGNSQVKVLNGSFTGNQLDAIYNQGAMEGEELAGNHGDCSGGIVYVSHCFASHSCYGSGNMSCGAVHNLNWHDNIELCAQGQFCNEIGSFFGSDIPQPSMWIPTKVLLAHNLCTNNTLKSAGCDSLSSVTDYDVDGDKFDLNATLTVGAPFEFISGYGSARGLETLNCNPMGSSAVVIDEASDFVLSDSTLCGLVSVVVSDAMFFSPNVNRIRLHHNKVAFTPSYPPFSTTNNPGGCFNFQLNTASSNGGQYHVDHNDCTGISTADGYALVAILQGACMSGINQVSIDGNTANSISYGLNVTATTPCAPTQINYTGNLLGPGVAQFSPSGPGGAIYNNPGQLSNQVSGAGPVPTVTLFPVGAGTGATYRICNGAGTAFNGATTVSEANCTVAATPYAGLIIVVGGTGGATGQGVFTAGVPQFAFDRGPSCVTSTIASNSSVPVFSSLGGNTATLFSFFNFGAAVTNGTTYQVGYYCPPN